MNIVVFLGAGVSIPSGLPTAANLTKMVLESPYQYAGNRRFTSSLTALTAVPRDDVTPRIRKLLEILKAHDTRDIQQVCYYLKGNTWASSGAIFRGMSTYEDLFFLCQQIRLWNIGLIDNSLITPFMMYIQKEAGSLLLGNSIEARMNDLGSLAGLACNLIETVVADSLRTDFVDGLNLIRELALCSDVEHLDIATLNHDILVERVLTTAGIPFVNGFGPPDGDVRWFDDSLFNASNIKVRILKLHGSLDWYSCVVTSGARPAMISKMNAVAPQNAIGQTLSLVPSGPSFLTGLDKAVSYQRGIYADVHFRFQESLRRSDLMIMSGYGWGDTGINFQLEKWLDQRRFATLILLHRNPDDLLDKSLILSTGFEWWVKARRVVPIRKWLSEVAIDELSVLFRSGKP